MGVHLASFAGDDVGKAVWVSWERKRYCMVEMVINSCREGDGVRGWVSGREGGAGKGNERRLWRPSRRGGRPRWCGRHL